MSRKSNPQPLTLRDAGTGTGTGTGTGNSLNVNPSPNFIDTPRSPLSPISPRSPKSPFRLSTKKGQDQSENPSMQAAESQQSRTTLPPSQNTVSLPSLQQYSGNGAQEKQQKQHQQERERERPVRSGFFSNYKASKSSSRLQNSDTVRQVTEDSMSRDTDRPAMPVRVSSQENTRNGTTHSVSSRLSLFRRKVQMLIHYSCWQNPALIDPQPANQSVAPPNPMSL